MCNYGTCPIYAVPCEQLTNTSGEMILCMFGDDRRPSYEDTCIFKCNTGYELIGNNIRICQSNGSWSGTSDVCEKGINFYHKYVSSYIAKNRCLLTYLNT